MEQTKAEQIRSIEEKFSNKENFSDISLLINDVKNVLSDVHTNDLPNLIVTIKNSKFNNFTINLDNYFTNLAFENCTIQTMNLLKPQGKIKFDQCDITSCSIIDGEAQTEAKKRKIQFIGKKITEVYLSGTCNSYFENVEIEKLKFSRDREGRCYAKVSFFEKCNISLEVEKVREGYAINDFHFSNCVFNQMETMPNFNFSNDISFIGCEFLKTKSSYEPIYRQLKKTFSEHRNDNTSNLFGSLELKCNHERLTFKNNGYEFLFSWIYKAINDFGLKPYRPLKIILLSFIPIYLLRLIFSEDACNSFDQTILTVLGPFKYLSSTKLTFNSVIVEVLSNLIFGFLWFFLIIGIRKRFKIEK